MAIYHLSVKVISRSSGRSAVGAAAYRAGEELKNERDGIIHDYTKKTGIAYKEIMLPKNAPPEYQDRGTLWNAVEKSEKRKDAQTAREIEVALPAELSRKEQIKLLQDFVKSNYTSRGMCADICIHDKKDGNPHAHIMLTTREVTRGGFGKKVREWNDKTLLENWRKEWAVHCNRIFEKKNLNERIDHRTLQAQGIDREPQIHKGVSAHQMEKRGIKSDRGRLNEEVRARNMNYQKDFAELEKMVQELKAQPSQEQEPAPAVSGAVQQPGREEAGGKNSDTRREIDEGLKDLVPQEPEQPTKPKPSGSTTGQDSGEKATQKIADKLYDLETDYIHIELVLLHQRQEAEKARTEQQQREAQAEKIKRDADNIKRLQTDIDRRTADRGSLGMFKGKEKKQLDEEIKSLGQSKDQATQTFKRQHGIEPEQAQQAIDRLKAQAAAIRSSGMGIMEQTKLLKQQKAIEAEYKLFNAISAIRPDSKRITEILKARRQESHQGESMAERTARAQAVSKLTQTPTPAEYKAIVQKVAKTDPDKALKILDMAKAHYNNQGRGIAPGQGRNHSPGIER